MYTFVVIDDEPLVRKGTIKKTEHLSHLITCTGEAANGNEALEIIELKNPDIIITDMNMPILDGTQLLPIISDKYPDKIIIVISGYKDFEYMKHAITAKAVDYILKPFSRQDIENSILRGIKQLENNEALHNQIISGEEKQEASHYEYDTQKLKNMILGYHSSNLNLSSKKLKYMDSTHDLILITLHFSSHLEENIMGNYLSENSFGDLAFYLQHLHQKNLGFLILFIPQHSALSPKELSRQVLRSLNHFFMHMNQSVSFGISNPHHSLSDVHEAFLETVEAFNSRSIHSDDNIFYLPLTERETKTITWDKTDEFLFRIEASMPTQVSNLLEELFDYFTKIPNCTLYDIKVFCFWLSDQVTYMLSPYFEQVSPSSASSSMQNILNSMFDLKEIKDYYLQFYLNITHLLKEISVYPLSNVIEEMKIYIQRHYQNNLTIEFLSSLFYMNRSYLSHLFKEKTGEKFVDYLNDIRIEKAKQLLRTTDKKMYQIAKSVGYDNVKYFFRVFKKKEQMTPEQYRNSEQ